MIIANGKTEGFNNKLFNNNKTNGFTIIEVVLVLAIAGLIFLVVFLALPALQKSQRDNARKQDVAKIVAGLQQYLVDHDNSLPVASTTNQWSGTTGYFAGMGQVTSIMLRADGMQCGMGWNYGYLTYASISPGCKCDVSNGNTTVVASEKYASVSIYLENGSKYCQDF